MGRKRQSVGLLGFGGSGVGGVLIAGGAALIYLNIDDGLGRSMIKFGVFFLVVFGLFGIYGLMKKTGMIKR